MTVADEKDKLAPQLEEARWRNRQLEKDVQQLQDTSSGQEQVLCTCSKLQHHTHSECVIRLCLTQRPFELLYLYFVSCCFDYLAEKAWGIVRSPTPARVCSKANYLKCSSSAKQKHKFPTHNKQL